MKLGICKICGRFGFCYGVPTYSICKDCLKTWHLIQTSKFLKFSKGKSFAELDLPTKKDRPRTTCLSCGYDGEEIQGENADLYRGYGCPKCHSPLVVIVELSKGETNKMKLLPICPVCKSTAKVTREYQCVQCGMIHYSCDGCKVIFTVPSLERKKKEKQK